jgi:aminopeptidase N
VLRHPSLDAAFKALVLTLPSEGYVAEQLEHVDPQRIHAAHAQLQRQLAEALHEDWAWAYEQHRSRGAYQPQRDQAGARALANLALAMLCQHAVARGDAVWPGRAYQQVKDAGNMSDRLGALRALVDAGAELSDTALRHFHAAAQGDALVVDKWFEVQAKAAGAPGSTLARARTLLQHTDFSLRNPNRVRALVLALCRDNPAAFHRSDAAGYVFWADRLLELDAINPSMAARLARVSDRWNHLAEPYRGAAREAVARVSARSELSDDVREIVGRALDAT